MVIAIDPGLSGALALTPDGITLSIRDMPTMIRPVNGKDRRVMDPEALHHLLNTARLHASVLVLEQVGGMPGQSGPAAFSFGAGFGMIVGMATVLKYRIELVHPAHWKGVMKCPSDKDGARSKASELWPAYESLWPLKKHDGRAEAAILALYGWQVFGALKS